jgi:hypothetical protein
MHRLIQRTSSTKAIKSFQILHFDLIICNKAFDKTTCIAHFIDELICFSWIYSLINHKKKILLSVFKDLINQCDRIRFNERAIIRILRIDQKIFINKKLDDWMRAQEISWDWSTKNTSEQNEKFERFDNMLTEKRKCIREYVKLSKDFYSECYLVVAHMLNKTSTQILNWNSSLIFMQKLLKESIRNEIAHLKVFNCKTFSFLKEISSLNVFQLFIFDDTSSFKSASINIFVAIEISRFLSRKEISSKEIIWFCRKNQSLNKENNISSRKKSSLCSHSSKLSNELFETKNVSWNMLTSRNINFRINVVNIVQKKQVR